MPGHPWQISPLVPKDARLLVPLNAQVQWLHAREMPHRFHDTLEPEQMETYFAEWLAQDRVTCLTARAGGALCGYAIFEMQETQDRIFTKGETFGFLHQIVVDEGQRRQGIGLSLIEAAKSQLHAAGFDRLEASHWAFNRASAALMARAGLAPSEVFVEGSTSPGP